MCWCFHCIELYLIFTLDKFFEDCSHLWPLESVDNVEDVKTSTWGRAIGGVQIKSGLSTDGVSGEIQLLDRPGVSCATVNINASQTCSGFTVALWLNYWNRADGQRQFLFNSFGSFILYQESNDTLIIRIQRSATYCLKEIIVPAKIWSYLVISFDATVTPRILTIHRNGEKLTGFLRDEGCSSLFEPQFVSSSVSLGAGFGVFARATFAEVAIWNFALSDKKIGELSLIHMSKFANAHSPFCLKTSHSNWAEVIVRLIFNMSFSK